MPKSGVLCSLVVCHMYNQPCTLYTMHWCWIIDPTNTQTPNLDFGGLQSFQWLTDVAVHRCWEIGSFLWFVVVRGGSRETHWQSLLWVVSTLGTA